MGAKDKAEKSLFAYNDVFSDIINGLLFDGDKVVKPEELTDVTPGSVFRGDAGELREQERDILKRWSKGNVDFALIGIENQTVPEKFMPARIMCYDGASYKSQLLEGGNLLVPVVTVVLNLGEAAWSYPTNLKGIMDNIPPEIDEYVNDYTVHVVNVADFKANELEKFSSDFKIIAEYLHDTKTNENNVRKSNKNINHVDGVLKVLSALTDSDTIRGLMENYKTKEGHIMRDLFLEAKNEGFDEGKIIGFEDGKTVGFADGKAKGKTEGERRFFELTKKLFAAGRITELEAAADDESIREKLLREFEID